MNTLKIERLIEMMVARISTAQLQIECRELDLNQPGVHGRTPLMVAAAEGLLTAIKTLVRNGASVHAAGHYNMTALHEAAANGEATVARYLISLGARVDVQTTQGVTPLMCAAAGDSAEVTRMLLEAGADPTKTDHSGATAIDVAYEKGAHQVVDVISSYRKGINQ